MHDLSLMPIFRSLFQQSAAADTHPTEDADPPGKAGWDSRCTLPGTTSAPG
jgi:hypothetical protein